MNEMTVTEALAEIKLIEKKVSSKMDMVMGNLWHPGHFKDPLGDGKKVVASELQSIDDLTKRLVSIRGAIAKANLETKLVVNDFSMCIAEWLSWKKDVAPSLTKLYKDAHSKLKTHLDMQSTNPAAYKDEEGKAKLVEWHPNVDYKELLDKAQLLNDVFEKLDGQLSLKNATTVIRF